MRRQTITLLIILISITLGSCFGGVIIGRIWQYSSDSKHKAYLVARSLEIYPEDWKTIKQYVYCDVLEIGANRKSIQAEFIKINSYKIGAGGTYFFYDPFVTSNLGEIYLVFDNNDYLEEKYKRLSFGELSPLECPKR